MPLINCEVDLILTWSTNCVVIYTKVANHGGTFTITGTRLCVPVATLSTQDNVKLLPLLKSGLTEQLIGTNIDQNQNYLHKIQI